MHLPRSVRKGAVGCTSLAAVLIMASAGPASAATGSGSGGSGTLFTELEFQSAFPPCAVVDGDFRQEAEISSGTYSSGAATYSGPVTLEWETVNTSTWYEGPDGTHGTDSLCDDTDPGEPWTVEAYSSGTNAQGSTVFCEYTGTFSRVDFDMVLDLEGECDIDENGTDGSDQVNNSPTAEARVSTLGECTTSDPPGPPEECDTFDDGYVATNL